MPKILGQRGGGFDVTDKLEKKDNQWLLNRDGRAVFIVLGDDTDQTVDDIYSTEGLPQLFDVVAGSVVRSRRAQEIDTVIHPSTGVPAILWHVEYVLDSQVDQTQKSENPEDDLPENRRPSRRWSGEQEEETLTRTADDLELPIQTANGEPIIVTRNKCLPILTITRYELAPFDPDVILAFVDHVNEKPFLGAPKGTVLMMPIETEEEVIKVGETSILYERVTYTLKFRIEWITDPDTHVKVMKEDTWAARPLHQGYKYRKEPGGKIFTWLDPETGSPEPVNLDENGVRIESSDPDDFHYLEFRRYPYADFDLLQLVPPEEE